MFWGLRLKAGCCYTKEVKEPFHVSMTALDIWKSGNRPVQVVCIFEGNNYLLCTPDTKDKVQCPLQLDFEVGVKVSFFTIGKAHVHLTGYLKGTAGEDVEEEKEEANVLKKKKSSLKVTTEGRRML